MTLKGLGKQLYGHGGGFATANTEACDTFLSAVLLKRMNKGDNNS